MGTKNRDLLFSNPPEADYNCNDESTDVLFAWLETDSS
jgi:hypothetical protein